jgi:hypothetical protein
VLLKQQVNVPLRRVRFYLPRRLPSLRSPHSLCSAMQARVIRPCTVLTAAGNFANAKEELVMAGDMGVVIAGDVVLDVGVGLKILTRAPCRNFENLI